MSIIKLRAHHGLCITFFEGKGYDDRFIMNMRAVISTLNQSPEIIIVDNEDMICAACPNNKGGVCDCADKVARYDKTVLKLCNVINGDIMTWEEYKTLVGKKIIEAGKLNSVCGDCQWSDICLKAAT